MAEDVQVSMGGGANYSEQTLLQLVQHFRIHANIERIPCSVAIQQLISYVTANEEHDILCTGFQVKSQNPYKEKRSCTTL
ncbi:hypothetical protein SNEBB_007650 [Seison nebaliae]|nr:hypothetical protein SNEBB_007650 [Seison nebaliae]